MNGLNIVGLVADILGILGAAFAFAAWLQAKEINTRLDREKERQEQKIKIVLQHGSEKIDLPGSIRRSRLARAEVLGRIGMVKPSERFTLAYLNTPEFYAQIDQILDGNGNNTLTISCSQNEFNQFQS
ncbi:MAG: hypothetical protein ACPG8W_09270 [Candidatus Promineifilaceae bacterium]